MPWNSSDAVRHTKKAAGSSAKRRLWAKIANKTLRDTGDEGRAIRIANAAVGRVKKRMTKRIRKGK